MKPPGVRAAMRWLAPFGRLAPVRRLGALRGLPVQPDRLWKLSLAASAGVILVLAALALGQVARIRTLTALVGTLSTRLAAHERVVAVLESPTARTTTLAGSVQANVRLVYDRATGQGALVVTDLKDPGTGFVYQLWLLAGRESRSGGVFRPIPGQPVVLLIAADFRLYDTVVISVEQGPQGSSTGPTSAPVLAGTM